MKRLFIFFASILFLFSSQSFASTFNHNLSYGMTTTEVASLQQFLKDEGLFNYQITSTFGALTQNALIQFQQQQGILPANGYFGATTRASAETIISSHPEWTTTLSNTNTYTNVSGNSIKSPSYSSNGIPAGATAKCKDGTYSFSQNHRGSCSRHGGVSNWLY
ncbi:MAG: DUF3761 domain-containing protein [Candidatus Nomurabacteria bacterium]